MTRVVTWIACLALAAPAAFAHPAPSSVMRLEFRADGVHAEYWVPVSQLEFARAADPGDREFATYLLRHVAAETADGVRWRIAIRAVRETTYLDHPYLVAELSLAPPAGAAPRSFVLIDDAVTHEVRNHVVYVVTRRGDANELVGTLQYPARRLTVAAR
jgi:hypothetical protein